MGTCESKFIAPRGFKFQKSVSFNNLTLKRGINITSSELTASLNDELTRGDACLVETRYVEAINYYQQALNLLTSYESLNEEKALAVISIYGSMALCKKMNRRFKECLELQKTALDYAQKHLSDSRLIIAGLNSCLGEAYHDLGQFSLAMDNYNKALSTRKEILSENDIVTALTYQKIALLKASLEKCDEAAKDAAIVFTLLNTHYKEAYSLWAISHAIVGNICEKGKKYKDAIKNYLKAVDFYQRAVDQAAYPKVMYYPSIGEVKLLFLECPEFFRIEVVSIYLNLARCYSEIDKTKTATEYFYLASKTARDISFTCYDRIAKDIARYVKL